MMHLRLIQQGEAMLNQHSDAHFNIKKTGLKIKNSLLLLFGLSCIVPLAQAQVPAAQVPAAQVSAARKPPAKTTALPVPAPQGKDEVTTTDNRPIIHRQRHVPLLVQEEDQIATDRPDFVESSNVVGKGKFQIETSFAMETDKRVPGTKVTTYATPTLLRYGTSEDWEVRLETDGYLSAKSETAGVSTSENGMADISLGAKWHSQDQKGIRPSVGWLVHMDFASGDAPFRGDGVQPSLRAVFEWELDYDMSAGIMPGVASLTNGTDRYVAGIFAVVVGKSLTDELRTFVEVSGQEIAAKKYGGSIVTYDVGFAYLLTKTVQLDIATSIAANDDTPNNSWTLGLSAKF